MALQDKAIEFVIKLGKPDFHASMATFRILRIKVTGENASLDEEVSTERKHKLPEVFINANETGPYYHCILTKL